MGLMRIGERVRMQWIGRSDAGEAIALRRTNDMAWARAGEEEDDGWRKSGHRGEADSGAKRWRPR